MQVVGVTGPEPGDDVSRLEPLLDRLAESGPVGLITRTSGASDRVGAAADPVATIDPEDGLVTTRWRVDDANDLSAVLDRFANAGLRYTVVVAIPGADLPRITFGGAIDDAVIASVDPADLAHPETLERLVERIDELEPYETLTSLVERIERHPNSPKAGAIATFTGRVRAENIEGYTTTHLEYEKYDPVADEEMAAIREELTDRDGVFEVLLYHHTGIVEAEEDAVYVVVLAGHREEAFQTVSDAIDLLKARVPIFKKEVTDSGEFWAHDRP